MILVPISLKKVFNSNINMMKMIILGTNPVFVLRNLPLIDFLDPTVKINQIVLKNITDDRFFEQVPKVDRCITFYYRCVRQGVVGAPRGKERNPRRRFREGPIYPQLKEFAWPSGRLLSVMSPPILLGR